jgi:serine/threonine-protein kinase RsbW
VLLATEAVTNAIEHGNALDPTKKVYLRVAVRDKDIELVVEDEGSGFDPAKTDDPTESENLFREGGRGLLFMEEIADEVRFEKEGRLVRLIFHAT